MKYRYNGPVSGVTLDSGEQAMLHPGAEVTLPEAHEYVQTLVALGHLTAIKAQAKTKNEPKEQI